MTTQSVRPNGWFLQLEAILCFKKKNAQTSSFLVQLLAVGPEGESERPSTKLLPMPGRESPWRGRSRQPQRGGFPRLRLLTTILRTTGVGEVHGAAQGASSLRPNQAADQSSALLFAAALDPVAVCTVPAGRGHGDRRGCCGGHSGALR